MDTTYHGVYAATYIGSNYLLLGVNQLGDDVLYQANGEFKITQQYFIEDTTVVGLAFKNTNLYFSYRNRRIELSELILD